MTQLDWKPSCQHLSQSDQSEFDPNEISIGLEGVM